MNKHFTIVKIVSSTPDYKISTKDMEHWREVFANNPEEVEKATETGEIVIEKIPVPEDDQYITLVKVGDDAYRPTLEDLKAWREIFEEAAKDPDFKIFTHPAIEIDVIKLGKVVAVE